MTPTKPASNSPAKGPSPTGLAVSSKIQPGLPDRLAVVYARQSTIQQVTENRESTASMRSSTGPSNSGVPGRHFRH